MNFEKVLKKLFKNKIFIIFLFVVLYLILYYDFYMCDFISGDEAYQLSLIKWPFSKIIYYCSVDYHVPLFAILTKIFSYLPFTEIFTSRLLLSLIVIAHFVIAFFPIERLTNRKISLLYSSLFLLSPILIYFVMQIRMYSLADLNLLCVLIYSLLVIKYDKKSDWIKLIIVSILACYSFLLTTFITFMIFGICFLYCFLKKEYKKMKKFLLCFIVVFCFFVPWLPTLFKQLLNVQSTRYWRWFPGSINFVLEIISIFIINHLGGLFISFEVYSINLVLILLIIVAYIYNIFILKKKIKNDNNIKISYLIAILSFLVILLYTYFNKTFAVRYFSIIYSLFLFSIVYYFYNNINSFIKSAFIIFILCFCVNYYFTYNCIFKSINNLDSMSDKIKNNSLSDEDIVIYHPFETSLEILGYKYLNDYKHFIVYDNYCKEQKNVLRDYSLFGDNVNVLNNVKDITKYTNKFYLINAIYDVETSSDCMFDLFDEFNWNYKSVDKYYSGYNGDIYELYLIEVSEER